MAPDFLEIHQITRSGRPARWGIDYYSPWDLKPDGTKRRIKRFFRQKRDRLEEIDRLLKRFAEFGKSAGRQPTPAELEDYYAMRSMLPPDVTGREAARVYLQQIRPETPRLARVFARYLASLRSRGLSEPWIRNVRSTLRMFLAFMPARARVGDVTVEHGRAWMQSLEPKIREGKPVAGYADESRNNYRRRVHAAFEYAIAEAHWTRITENPIARVEVPAVRRSPPTFYSVDEARAILAATMLHRPEFVAFVVLRMFAGIRRSEVLRMQPGDIHVRDRVIDLPGFRRLTNGRLQRVTKSGKGRLIENLPPVIWRWLEQYPRLHTADHQRRMREIHELAGVRAKRNGFRHSFPTYHCAVRQSADHTILILGQEEDSKVFYAHYRNPRVRQEIAESYFGLGPENVVPCLGGTRLDPPPAIQSAA